MASLAEQANHRTGWRQPASASRWMAAYLFTPPLLEVAERTSSRARRAAISDAPPSPGAHRTRTVPWTRRRGVRRAATSEGIRRNVGGPNVRVSSGRYIAAAHDVRVCALRTRRPLALGCLGWNLKEDGEGSILASRPVAIDSLHLGPHTATVFYQHPVAHLNFLNHLTSTEELQQRRGGDQSRCRRSVRAIRRLHPAG